MKDNVYRDAVSHLQFSDNLEQAVLRKADEKKPWLRPARLVAIGAILSVLLVTTAFAAEQISEWTLRRKEEGRIRSRFHNAVVMQFTASHDFRGVEVHQMELKPKGYYHFGEGLIYHPTEGFLEVTDDYKLRSLKSYALHAEFEKHGRIYELDMKYVEANGGIYSNLLNYYPVQKDEILVNMTSEGSHGWPVYVNIKTGECRDALPAYLEKDFLPEKLESGYEGRIGFSQPFRDGILISSLVTGMRNGSTDSRSLHYWVKTGSRKAIKLDLPKNSIDFIVDDTLYYQDSEGYCYVMDENFSFRKLDGILETTDNLNCGLLTVCNPDGALEIVDVVNSAVFMVPDLNLEGEMLWDTTGYNATRHSTDGKIMVTHSYNDWQKGSRPVDMLSYLDVGAGELRQLYFDTDLAVQTHGWLDDNRYCVIYEEGLKRFMAVYEFQ